MPISPRDSHPFAFLVIGLATTLAGVNPLVGQDSATSTANPFAGFETHYLQNGVKVWFKDFEGAPDVAVSVGVPVGRDADPPGKAHLAHFLEHMLFTDHNGRSEQEIRDAITTLGGRHSGLSYSDRTWFSVVIPRDHGLFAIEWLAGILSPHAMEPEIVDRNRAPLIVETGARPHDLIDLLLRLMKPEALGLPTPSKQEWGADWEAPTDALWNSLHTITPQDLRAFYDRYYAPGAFTLTIVGDLDRGRALSTAERTFGSIPARPVHRKHYSVRDPERMSARYKWRLQAAYTYGTTYKLFNPIAEDLLTLRFIRRVLENRINRRLRSGEHKVAYGVRGDVETRGPTAFLKFTSRIDRGELDFAREAIEEEIELLRSGVLGASEFEEARAAIVEQLRSANQTTESLNLWTAKIFYDPDIFSDFPDLLSFYQTLTQEQVTSFAASLFDESRHLVHTTYPSPVGPAGLLAVCLALCALVLAVAKWEPGGRVAPSSIRYIARMPLPIVLSLVYSLGGVLAFFVVVVIARAAFALAVSPWLYTIDSVALQTGIYAVFVVAVLFAVCRLYGSIPHELVVGRGELRVRSRSWRARILKAEDIAEISTRSFRAVWLTRRLPGGLPLTFGIREPGIYLRPKRGRSYFFRTRITGEFKEVLQEWWKEGRSSTPTAPPEG